MGIELTPIGHFLAKKLCCGSKGGVLDIPQSDPVYYIYTILNYSLVILIGFGLLTFVFRAFSKKR